MYNRKRKKKKKKSGSAQFSGLYFIHYITCKCNFQVLKNIVGADIPESGLEVRRNNQCGVCSIIRQAVSSVASDTGIV